MLFAPVPAFAAYRQTYGFVNKWAFPTPWPSSQFLAHGMAIAPSGDLIVGSHDTYVADYTTTGTYMTTFGSTVTNAFGLEGFDTADNVAVHGTDMWVLDYDKGVAKLDTDGNYSGVSVVSADGSALEQMEGVAVDASGCVYVTDHGSSDGNGYRVSKFTSNGTWVTSFGDGTDPLWMPHSVAVGPDWRVYVADGNAGAVRQYTASDLGRTSYTQTGKWTSSAFEEPQGVATDAQGNVFVLDASSNTVTKLSSAGVPLAHWGGTGSANGSFTNAYSLVVASDGHVFVDDRDGAFVQEFKLLDLGPTTAAAGTVTVKKGKNASFKYRADEDISSTVKAVIRIYKGSKLKATISCGTVSQGVWHTKSWKCKLVKGTYTWKVYATDAAGHTQRNVAAKSLKVK